MVAAMIWASVWPMGILPKIKISNFHAAKISKNWTRKKSGNFTTGDPWEPWSTHSHSLPKRRSTLLSILHKCALFGSSGGNIIPYYTEMTDYVVLSYRHSSIHHPSIIYPSTFFSLNRLPLFLSDLYDIWLQSTKQYCPNACAIRKLKFFAEIFLLKFLSFS